MSSAEQPRRYWPSDCKRELLSIFDALEYIAANQLEAEQNEIRCAIHTMKTALSESNAPDGSFSSQLKPNRNVRTAGQIVVFWVNFWQNEIIKSMGFGLVDLGLCLLKSKVEPQDEDIATGGDKHKHLHLAGVLCSKSKKHKRSPYSPLGIRQFFLAGWVPPVVPGACRGYI